MSLKFQKTTENFICLNCGTAVKGTGYTNHCPVCLYSKHVDNFPGDRANPCGDLMRPIGLENKNSEWKIIHKCLKCNIKKSNKLTEEELMVYNNITNK